MSESQLFNSPSRNAAPVTYHHQYPARVGYDREIRHGAVTLLWPGYGYSFPWRARVLGTLMLTVSVCYHQRLGYESYSRFFKTNGSHFSLFVGTQCKIYPTNTPQVILKVSNPTRWSSDSTLRPDFFCRYTRSSIQTSYVSFTGLKLFQQTNDTRTHHWQYVCKRIHRTT